jgi:predicted nucleic acid-binding protein
VIGEDPDDNAFTDCAIAAHADFVITEDHHFKLLANAGYKPQPITPADFMDRYRGLYV